MKRLLPAAIVAMLLGLPAIAIAADSRGLEHAASTTAPKVDPAFVGHYYLSGVMETGSELLLREDGTFEWFISYGAVDQTAKGTWAREQNAIVLRTASPSTGQPLFTFREVEPWSEAAEDELLRQVQDRAEEEVRARCPFLEAAVDVAAAPSVLMDASTIAPGKDQLRAVAAKALSTALAARSAAEKLAAAEMATSSQGDHATDGLTAAEAMNARETAKWEAIDAARKAGLPEPELVTRLLPAAFTLPVRRTAKASPERQWTGGLGLRVYDMASGQGARDVKVRLHLADGTKIALVTARRGLVLLAEKPSSAVVAVDLAADYAPGRDQTLTIAPTTFGIIHVTIDAGQIVAPPFDTLRLPIAGPKLLFEAMGKGRYERP